MNYEFYQKLFFDDQYNEKSKNFLNISKKVEFDDIQNYKSKISKKTNAHLTIFEFFLTCRNCSMIFYFNNKLHKHLKTFCKEKIETDANFEKKNLQRLFIIEFFKKNRNHKKYEFRSHQYATTKMTLSMIEKFKDLCIDFEIFMFLINRKFVKKKISKTKILTTRSFIKIKEIENKLHDNFQYCEMKFFIFEKFKNEQIITNIKAEIHLMNDLKINVFLKTNILIFEKIILNFAKKKLIIIICDNMIISIKIDRKKKIVNRTIKIFEKIVMISKKLKIIFVKVKRIKLSKNRDFNFFFILNSNFDSKESFFAHVIESDIKTVQV